MPILEWDQVGQRVFERGVEKGVLYLPNGNAVPWNGLTSIIEETSRDSSPVYFDGQMVNNLVTLGNFTGTLSAITYPDEFLELEGLGQISAGVFVGEQRPQSFALSYRTMVGSDLDTASTDYKIHILYNVVAVPSEKEYLTVGEDIELTEFEWAITAVPEEVPGFRPSAHVILDSRYTDPALLSDVELALYGGNTANAQLPAFADLMELIMSFFRVEIIDNKNGTWTATTNFDGYISMISLTEFQLDGVDATYLDADTYTITDSRI